MPIYAIRISHHIISEKVKVLEPGNLTKGKMVQTLYQKIILES